MTAGLVACSAGGARVAAPGTEANFLANDSTAVRTASVPMPAAHQPAPANATANATIMAINAGGRSVNAWRSDTDYNGGWVATVSNAIDVTHVSSPAPQNVYQSQRYGKSVTYTIAHLNPNASYSLRLHLAESYWHAAGARLFDVIVNGTRVLSHYDIFAQAGGANIAIAPTIALRANSGGQVTIAFVADKDNASVAGVELIDAGGSPTPAPTSTPGGDALPWIYAQTWSPSSPFRTTVDQHKAAGANVVSHTYMDALWNEGIAHNGTAAAIPIFTARSSDRILAADCTMFGGRCDASGVKIHVPTYAVAQQSSDGHLTVVDPNAPNGPVEVDCWQAVVSGSTLSCSWAGAYNLGSAGTDQGGEGIHGGMAVTTVFVTGAEWAQGHIDHALGLNTSCLNDPSRYPANTAVGTDNSCDGSSNPPHYGNLVHLLWSADKIAQSAYSAPCKVILTALAKYGAYLDDTGNNGLQINTEGELSYTADPATRALDPFPQIQQQLRAGGDGGDTTWSSCLNRMSSSDFELIEIAQH